MDDPQSRRLRAELELEQAVHSLTIHELGNPLQSLLVLVELARDELGPGRTADRLDRALESIGLLRHALLRSTAVRLGVHDSERIPVWGPVLDSFEEFARVQLDNVRANLVRSTVEIDGRPIVPDTVRAATLSLLLGACTRVRAARQRDLTVELQGRVQRDQTTLRVAITSPHGPIELPDSVEAQVHDLLGTDARVGCRRDAGALVIWSA